MAVSALVVLLACVLTVEAIDPCQTSNLIDEVHRSTAYQSRRGDALICDRVLPEGWYRFVGAEMPFGQCVKPYHCGTHVPIWLKGSAPSVQDGTVSRTACGQMRSDGDCCQYKTTISVRNCGPYMVYYLRPLPGCSMAYCAGHRPVCGPGEFSPTGHPPCSDLFPKMTTSPHLTPPIVEEPDFKFLCEIPVTAPSTDASVFKVTWLVDEKPLKSVTVSSHTRFVALYGRELNEHTSTTLTCSVQSSFVRPNSTTSPSIKSNGYWIGVKYNTTHVHIDHAHTKETVELTSTIPVVCTTVGDQSCSVSFKITTDNEHVHTDRCFVVLKPGHWNPVTHTASTTFVITTEPMFAKGPHTITHIQTKPYLFGTGVDKTSSKSGALCTSTGDPHIKTFDGHRRYDNYKVGQFLLVKQRQGGSFRVEARTWKCGRVSCNCAIAAREGNDVITFDMCGGKYGHTVPQMKIKHPKMFTNRTQIIKDPSGNKHMLNFPSGAMVTVTSFKTHIDVAINVPTSFCSDTEGACGFYDGSEANDFTRSDGTVDQWMKRPNAFTESWRIPDGQSLFEVAKPLPIQPVGTQMRCRCGTGTMVDCTDKQTISNHISNVLCPGCIPVTPPISPPQISVNLTIHSSTSPSPVLTTTPHLFVQSTMPSIITATPIPKATTDRAKQTCAAALNKDPSLFVCTSTTMSLEYKDIFDLCINDMALTDNPDMALSAVNTLMEGCVHKALVNPSSIPQGSIKIDCPRACSLNGKCVNGKCICDSGYESSDCSVKSSEAPKISAISGGRYCDMQTEDCFKPVVIGENMYGSNMKCISEEMGNYNGNRYILQTDTNSVDFHSTKFVTCNINPPPKGTEKDIYTYMVSLSRNGGATVGNQYNYTVYNSKCLACSESQPFAIKPNTCFINEKCHMSGETDTEDHTGFCEPAQSNTDWTPFRKTTGMPSSTLAATTSSSVKDYRYYTGTSTGCGCYYDPTKTDCACCANFGCPCTEANHDRCYDCFNEAMCIGS